MKKTIFLLFIIFSTSTFGSINEKFILSKEEKKFIENTNFNVSISKQWRPFAFESNKGLPSGVSTEVWKLLEKKLQLKTSYTFFESFTKQLESLKSKEQDIIFSTGKTKDREQYAIFTKPYLSFPLSVAIHTNNVFNEKLEKIKNLKIAVGKSFTAHKILMQAYPELELMLVDTIEDGLKAVEEKKAFAYIDVKPNLTYNIEKLALKNIKIAKDLNLEFQLTIMIRDDYKLLKSALNKAILSLDKKEIEKILQKWENIYFEESFNYKFLWIILCVFFAVMFLLAYLNQLTLKRNKLLQEKVEERTSELKDLNKSLQKTIDLKTKELKKANYLLAQSQKIAHLGSFQYNIKEEKIIFSEELYKIFSLNKKVLNPSLDMILSYVHKDDIDLVRFHLKKILVSKEKLINEFRIITDDHAVKYLQISSKVKKYNEAEEPIQIIGSILDISKIKILEAEKAQQAQILAQQSKMAAMGEMLENIAHQWRQPLSVISTAATGMQLELELNNSISNALATKSINAINEHAQYLSKTIDDFRNFFNPNKEKKFFKISSCIRNAIFLVKEKCNSNNIKIYQDFEDIEMNSLESELLQVLLNILNNSIDALILNNIEKKIIFISLLKENENVVISIKDNARGVPENIISRIFEPYFTTKHKAQGTGIGLYMSSQIVTKHLKGEIKLINENFYFENERYSGANFKVIIPLKV